MLGAALRTLHINLLNPDSNPMGSTIYTNHRKGKILRQKPKKLKKKKKRAKYLLRLRNSCGRTREDLTQWKDTSTHDVLGQKESITEMSIFPKLTYKFNIPVNTLYQSRFSQAKNATLCSSTEGILSRDYVVKENQRPDGFGRLT